MSRRSLTDAELADPLVIAIVLLEKGKRGPDQPATVKSHLRALELAGMASYTEKDGWRRTVRGEVVHQEVLATAKRRAAAAQKKALKAVKVPGVGP
jgi:hypothetical protein